MDPAPHLSDAIVEHVNRRALQRLTETEREVLAMGREDGLSYDEIAELRGTSVATVRLLLLRALGVYQTECRAAGIVAPARNDASKRPPTQPPPGKTEVGMRKPDYLETIADYFFQGIRGDELEAFEDEVDANLELWEFMDVLDRIWLEPVRERPSLEGESPAAAKARGAAEWDRVKALCEWQEAREARISDAERKRP